MARKKENLEFRYYDVPHGEPLLALYGDVTGSAHTDTIKT